MLVNEENLCSALSWKPWSADHQTSTPEHRKSLGKMRIDLPVRQDGNPKWVLITRMIREGAATSAIARTAGCTERHVRRLKRRMRGDDQGVAA